MKKRLLILIALCTAVMGYSQTVGDTFIDNFITYEITSTTDNTVKTIDYNISGGNSVNIPASVIHPSSNVSFNVTEIGADSFSAKNLSSVSLPNSLTTIGEFAFFQNIIVTISIPSGVTEIGNGAFFVNLLTNANIPDGITTIGAATFGNNLIPSITIPNSVTSIGNSAFQNNSLTNITIPNGVTSIGNDAFKNNQLTNVTIPENINSIGDEAFSVNPLISITSESITPPSIITGNADTFAADRSVIDLTIPFGTTSDYIAAQWTGFNSTTEMSPVVGDTFVDTFITYEITSLSPNEVKTIDYDATNGGTDVDIPISVSYNSVSYDVIRIEDNAFIQKGLTSVIIPNSITSIGNSAFETNLLTNVTIPSGVTSIGDDAFVTNQLTSITIPDTVTTIGGGAFYDNQISNIVFGIGLTTISDNVFFGNQLTTVSIPEGITLIDEGAFRNNLLTSVVLPNSLTTMYDDVFRDNLLTTISLPSNLTIIGPRVFQNNQLTNITIPSNVTDIDQNAFNGNPLATVTSEATIPPNIYTGSNDSFATDRSGIDLFIPYNTTPDYIAAQWTGFNTTTEIATVGATFIVDFITYEITSTTDNTLEAVDYDHINGGLDVQIPATVSYNGMTYNVTGIGSEAFQPIQANEILTSVIIPNSVTYIDYQAFRYNQLVDVIIPDSVITIGYEAFYENTTITSVTLGSSLEVIGDDAFAFNLIASITFPSSLHTIQERAFENNPLLDVYSESLIPPTIVTGVGGDTFGDRSNTNLHIPEGTTGVYVTDTGALWTDFLSVTEDAVLGNSNFELKNEVTVVNTGISLQITASNGTQLNNYAIYSMNGAKVKEGIENTIAIETLSKGVYVLQLIFDKGMFVQKFVR